MVCRSKAISTYAQTWIGDHDSCLLCCLNLEGTNRKQLKWSYYQSYVSDFVEIQKHLRVRRNKSGLAKVLVTISNLKGSVVHVSSTHKVVKIVKSDQNILVTTIHFSE